MVSKGKVSSYDVFMSFVTEENDASGILSEVCFSKWVSTRKSKLKQPEESFRRVLTAHVCGLIGRKPFPAVIEASLLRSLRKKQVWPCFKQTKVTIGIKGFRKAGFHESRRGIFGPNAGYSSLSPTSNIKINPALMANASRRTSESSAVTEVTEKDISTSDPSECLGEIPFQASKRTLSQEMHSGVEALQMFTSVKRIRTDPAAPPPLYAHPNFLLAGGFQDLPLQTTPTASVQPNGNSWSLI